MSHDDRRILLRQSVQRRKHLALVVREGEKEPRNGEITLPERTVESRPRQRGKKKETNPEANADMTIAPITGRLKKQLIMDLSIALGIGTVAGYAFWYGYHVPTVRHRDAFYAKLEQEKAAKRNGE